MNDYTNDFSGSGDQADRWNFYGNPSDFKSGSSSIPYCDFSNGVNAVTCTKTSGVSGIVTVLPASLAQQCLAVAPDPSTLHDGGCYMSGKSVMVPPKRGNLWHHGPEHLPGLGLQERGFLRIQELHVQGAVQRPVPGRVL